MQRPSSSSDAQLKDIVHAWEEPAARCAARIGRRELIGGARLCSVTR